MNDTNTGGPAFPFEYHNQTSRYQAGFFGTPDLAPGASQQFAGMTLRDYFAAKAMQVDYKLATKFTDPEWRYGVALDAYKMADAMLKAREA